MFATPVNVNGEKVNGYTYYRDSTAPYIISLALFVGMLILSFFVEFKKPAALPYSAMSWYGSKLLTLATFAIGQALLVIIVTLGILGLDVTNPGLFILSTIFVSLTFMAIIFFLVAFAGNLGRFIGLALIVLQLSITDSNLPIPMLPEGLRGLSSFLPMTYSISGLKSVISLGDTGMFFSSTMTLFIYFIIAVVLTFIIFTILYQSKYKQTTEENDVSLT